jgi:GntR family transcriptional regulator
MIPIDPQSPIPINDQIKAGVKGLVARGVLQPGDPLPSIRALAEQLLVNPNTVARAYRELGFEGLVESKRGEGNFIAEAARRAARDSLESVRQQFADAVATARRGGLAWGELDKLMAKAKGEEK